MQCPECSSELDNEMYCEECDFTFQLCTDCEELMNIDGFCTDCEKCPRCEKVGNQCNCNNTEELIGEVEAGDEWIDDGFFGLM